MARIHISSDLGPDQVLRNCLPYDDMDECELKSDLAKFLHDAFNEGNGRTSASTKRKAKLHKYILNQILDAKKAAVGYQV